MAPLPRTGPLQAGDDRNASNLTTVRRLLGIVVSAAVLVAPVAYAAPKKAASLYVTGQGGQSVDLVVPKGGLTVGYDPFPDERVAGPDGAVGGVMITRASDGELAGGMLLSNAPGFSGAVSMSLVEHDRTLLPPGRFRFTLLGTGAQTAVLELPGAARDRRLTGRGPARPVTRAVGSTAATFDEWVDAIGRVGPRDQVVIGAGSSGDLQQADENRLCLRAAGSGGPCLLGSGGGFLSPGNGSISTWSSELYGQGSIPPGSYEFSGYAAGVGPASTVAHLAVVISPPR